MRVLVAGAPGAIGVPLVRLLRKAGDEVVAVYLAAPHGAELSATGAVPVQADVLNLRNLLQAIGRLRVDAVIALFTSPQSASVTGRLRVDGVRNLLSVAGRLGALRFVVQSTVLGYGLGDSGRHAHAEGEPFGLPGCGPPDGYLAALRASEEQVLTSPNLDGIALRYGLLYGPGPASDAMVAGLRARQLPVTGDSSPVPWVLAGDAAAATVAALRLGERGAAYNVADDEPVSLAAMLTATARAVAAPAPRTVPGPMLAGSPLAKAVMAGGLRVSNAKAKAELGWMPRAATWRGGLRLVARHYQP